MVIILDYEENFCRRLFLIYLFPPNFTYFYPFLGENEWK